MRRLSALIMLMAALAGTPASAQQVVGMTVADSGDTAWLICATALALIASLPGLLMLFSARTEGKAASTLLVQGLMIFGSVSLLWVVCGYSLAFADGSPELGGLDNVMLANLAEIRADTTVPESSFVLFQMMPALFAALLVMGSVVERARLGWMFCCATLWSLLVYVPVAHWLWGDGWLAALGAHDYAGGLVVMASAGVSALVLSIMMGQQQTIHEPKPAFAMGGAGLIWLGFYGLCGGAALNASDDASTALINLHVAGCAGALVWASIERIRTGAVSLSAALAGALAGIAAIVGTAGYVGPLGAIVIGALAGLICRGAAGIIKNHLKISDPHHIFAIFGVGGLLGTLFFPFFVLPAFGGPGFDQGVTLASQFTAQLIAIGSVAGFSAVITFIIGIGLTLILPMREGESVG